MATSTHLHSTGAKKDVQLEERREIKPQLFIGTPPTIPALPVRRNLRVELDLASQLAHGRGQPPIQQLLENSNFDLHVVSSCNLGLEHPKNCLLYTSDAADDM
eukprot:7290800-Prorocentrum_lima.AAC.1